MRWTLSILSMLIALAATPGSAAEIPFRYVNGLIRVEVRVGNTPLWFLVDSGAAVSVLNASTARKLGLRDGENVIVKGLGGQARGRWPQKLNATVENISLPERYLVVDLCELEGSCAAPVDGLIGAEFFNGRVVEIDFQTRVLRLVPRAAMGPDVDPLPEIPLRKSRGVWMVEAAINGHGKQRLRLDTGCATGLHWVNGDSKVLSTPGHSVGLAPFASATGQCALRLGKGEWRDVPAVFHTRRIFAGEDGLLGNQFLSRLGVVTIDGCTGRIILGAVMRK